jgi:hypothetical protein
MRDRRKYGRIKLTVIFTRATHEPAQKRLRLYAVEIKKKRLDTQPLNNNNLHIKYGHKGTEVRGIKSTWNEFQPRLVSLKQDNGRSVKQQGVKAVPKFKVLQCC